MENGGPRSISWQAVMRRSELQRGIETAGIMRSMKGTQNTAIYLTCTKSKSFQRKHVDVCRRCKSNNRCKPYLEYRKSLPAEPDTETPTGTDMQHLLRDILHELREINHLVSGGKSGPLAPPPSNKNVRFSMQSGFIKDLRAALEDIRELW